MHPAYSCSPEPIPPPPLCQSEGIWLPVPHICTAVFRTNASLFCTPTPPQPLTGVRSATPSCDLRSRSGGWTAKTFQGLLFIFKSSFCFHLDSFDGWCIVLWHSEWKDSVYSSRRKREGTLNYGCCCSLCFMNTMKQRLGSDKRWMRQRPLFGSSKMTFTAELQSDAYMTSKKLIHLPLIETSFIWNL